MFIPAGVTAHQAQMRRVYDATAFQPLWSRDGKPTPQAMRTIAALAGAATHGLDAAAYCPDRLAAEARRLAARLHPPAREVALFDIALSDAVMRFASDLHVGRISPAYLGFAIELEARPLDLATFVADISRSADPTGLLGALDPPTSRFAQLREALAGLRDLMARADAPLLAAHMPSLHPGDRHAAIPAIRGWLAMLGDLPPTAPAPGDDTVYDDALTAAIQRFQQRHGRDVDAIIGPVTARDLQVPLAVRVQQIELAMERLRWAPRDVGRLVVVNIPEFRLRAFEAHAETPSLSMKVVVGSAARRTETPIVHAHMQWIVFRPYWNVPDSIARKEILPRVTRDAGYLAREHMEILDGRLRQRPGTHNALGLVKFVFPNTFGVYLHDTPQKGYFARSRRDLSHGCMRVADPVGLAAFLLGWERARIAAAMSDGPDDRWVEVPDRTPVYVLYATAAVEDGQLFFFDDIYGHDAALARALADRYAARCSWRD
jgi:murein L,D-transpeptidase YcbB/YkuD